MASGGYDHRIHIISPSGKRVRTILIGRLDVLKAEPDDTTVLLERQRFLGANIQHVPVPAGGEAGLFKLELGGYACQLASPITNLPHEAAVLPREAALRPGNRMLGYITADGPAALTVASLGYGHAAPRIPTVVYLRVEDGGEPLLETTLLNIARRSQETVSLPPRAVSVTLLGESTMSWTGAAGRGWTGDPRGADRIKSSVSTARASFDQPALPGIAASAIECAAE